MGHLQKENNMYKVQLKVKKDNKVKYIDLKADTEEKILKKISQQDIIEIIYVSMNLDVEKIKNKKSE
jgi:CHAT domain-containing protein